MTITEFLLARIAEDEELALAIPYANHADYLEAWRPTE